MEPVNARASTTLANILDLGVDFGVFVPDFRFDPPAVFGFHIGADSRA